MALSLRRDVLRCAAPLALAILGVCASSAIPNERMRSPRCFGPVRAVSLALASFRAPKRGGMVRGIGPRVAGAGHPLTLTLTRGLL